MTNSQIETLEKRGAQATGINQSSRCIFCASICAYGPRDHPTARLIKDIFTSWFLAIQDIRPECAFEELRLAWSTIKQELQQDNVNVLLANRHGLMHNVISWLIRLQWNPFSIDMWIHPDGSKWYMSGLHPKAIPKSLIICELVDSYNKTRLTTASTHRNSLGTENGVDFNCTLALGRSMFFKKELSLKAALDTIISDGCWTASRINECKPDFSPVCPRCRIEPETDFHTWWGCICNNDIQDDEVTSTQN